MISTSFGYGERESIAVAYAKMYAPKRMNESCEGGECVKKTVAKTVAKTAKKADESCGDGEGASKKTLCKLPVKHRVPAKTGSKLGVRKVLPFDKRDPKPSAKKFTPKVKNVAETKKHFCIADGDATLCTNDVGESYFNKGGVVGETRIYESKISAMKDIKKVQARRNPNTKYRVRACECIGESFQFVEGGHPVNEGLWDGLKSIGSGVLNAGKAVGNAVGGVAKAGGNLLQGNLSQAGSDLVGGLKDAGGNLADAAGGVVGGALDATLGTAKDVAGAAGGVLKAGGNALQGDFSQAGEDLKGAASSAMGAIADGAREADVAGAVSSGAKSVANGAGNVLKAAGNAVQGNFKEAGQNLGIGQSAQPQPNTAAAQQAAMAGKDTTKELLSQVSKPNAAVDSSSLSKEAEQSMANSGAAMYGQQAPAQNVTQSSTSPAQKQALAAGKGPMNTAAAAAATQPPAGQMVDRNGQLNSPINQQIRAMGGASSAERISQQAADAGITPQVSQQSKPAMTDANRAAKKAELQKQIDALNKELAALG